MFDVPLKDFAENSNVKPSDPMYLLGLLDGLYQNTSIDNGSEIITQHSTIIQIFMSFPVPSEYQIPVDVDPAFLQP